MIKVKPVRMVNFQPASTASILEIAFMMGAWVNGFHQGSRL